MNLRRSRRGWIEWLLLAIVLIAIVVGLVGISKGCPGPGAGGGLPSTGAPMTNVTLPTISETQDIDLMADDSGYTVSARPASQGQDGAWQKLGQFKNVDALLAKLADMKSQYTVRVVWLRVRPGFVEIEPDELQQRIKAQGLEVIHAPVK